MVQSVSVSVPPLLYTPPPLRPVELPLMVQSVRLSVPWSLDRPEPLPPLMASPEIAADP